MLQTKRTRLSDEPTKMLQSRPDEATLNVWRLQRSIRGLPLAVRLRLLFWWMMADENLAIFQFEYCEEVSVLVLVFFFFFFFVFFVFIHLVFFQFLYFTEDLSAPERRLIGMKYRLMKVQLKTRMMREVHQHLVSTFSFVIPFVILSLI